MKCQALLTPDDLYPTQVFSLSGDGWANYDNGANDLGKTPTTSSTLA